MSKEIQLKQRLLNLKEAALYLNMTPRSMRKWVWNQSIPVIQFCKNGKWRFDLHDLDQFIEKNKLRRQ